VTFLSIRARVLSVFFRSSCRALLTPHGVVLESGRRKPVRHQFDISCKQAGTAPEQFQNAVVHLLQWMDAQGIFGRRLHLVASDAWARPAVLPLPAKMATPDEINALLASHYRRVYGDLADGWRWCWDHQQDTLIAVAWPTNALNTLNAGLAQRHCVLASAKPLGADIFSQLPRSADSQWLMILMHPSVSLMRSQNGIIQNWCVTAHQPSLLPLQLAREAARRGDNCRSLMIVDLHTPSNTLNMDAFRNTMQADGWTVHPCPADAVRRSGCPAFRFATYGLQV